LHRVPADWTLPVVLVADGRIDGSGYDARAVIGPSVSDLHERVGACGSAEERARVTDGFLLAVLIARPAADGISASANDLLRRHGHVRIADLAHRTGLSLRQFERRCAAQIGLRPKLYARIARFEAALDSRARSQTRSWTEIAHAFGYHDQMHLIHDFERFSGETPTNVLAEVENAHQAQIDSVRMRRMPGSHGDAHRLML
jgi:AraC-like DNA-binding protein